MSGSHLLQSDPVVTRHTVASKIAETMLRHAREQNELLFAIKDECEADEWAKAKLMVGHVLAEIWLESLRPIFCKHPDLVPPGSDFEI